MKEDFLHYLWKNRIYNCIGLKTVSGDLLQIINVGMAHHDAGPDFKQATIKINDITWVGDVEIHAKSSDWIKHRHEKDAKYRPIVLHVVYQHDMEILRAPNEPYPTLELQKYITPALLAEYQSLSLSPQEMPCKHSLPQIPKINLISWLSRLAIERLQRKQTILFEMLHRCHENWNELLFQQLAISFGFKTNATAFELLSKSLPVKQLLKHSTSQTEIYALVFGQAGFLEQTLPEDDYYLSLQKAYNYLKHKYQLTPIDSAVWNLLRLRPHNFPCLRLAQFSELFYAHPTLIEDLMENATHFSQIRKILQRKPHPYWETHFHFGRQSSDNHVAVMGEQSTNLLIINTIIPVMYAFSDFRGDESLQAQLLNLYEGVSFEENHITKKYRQAGFPAYNALFSQAILELQRQYCQLKQCAACAVGCAILNKIGN